MNLRSGRGIEVEMRGRGCLSARGNRGDNREEERAYQHQEMAGIDDGDSGGGGGGRFRGIEDFHTLGESGDSTYIPL
jgi:hypothetical protein